MTLRRLNNSPHDIPRLRATIDATLMTLAARFHLLFVWLLLAPALHAEVPGLLNYQGRVLVADAPFTGTGLFKFALVDSTGATTYWSNDGSGSGGSEPLAAVSLAVTKGVYSVLLGDTNLANMTAVPASVFAHSDVRLRVWFNDGSNGSQLLLPDQRIAAVGYALMAKSVEDGAITQDKLAAGAVGSSHLATGAVGASQLASGAAAANLASGGQSAVGSGGLILSPAKVRL